jgi:hypothetical protein
VNRNLDGSSLTRGQLIEIAVHAGHDREAVMARIAGHGDIVALSHLHDMTRQERYEMFWRGELTLDSRPVTV